MGNKNSVRQKYDIKENLGKGSFAVVKRCVRKSDGKEFAVKVIKLDKLKPTDVVLVDDEIKIQRQVDHPHCVKLIEFFQSPGKKKKIKKVYMVLELLKGGELFDRIVAKGSYTEREAAELMKQVTEAIQYLHSINIVHRDMKPENLLYDSTDDDGMIKITDFGLAKAKGENRMNTQCGTPGYVAPEVLEKRAYGPEVDLWSLGVILYILLCGFPPFYHASTLVLYKQIKKGSFTFPKPYWTAISDDAKNLVSSLLVVDPKARATPADVLNHKWITGSAPDKNIGAGLILGLQTMQAKSKLRKGVATIIAMKRFHRALDKLKNDL